LFATPQKILKNICFPLGELSKADTRNYAKRMNLSISDKPESQDICFVQSTAKKGYREIVQKLRPDISKSGNIIHVNGRIMGKHNGIDSFTVGQRRGLGVISDDGTPLYVTKIDAKNNSIYVGSEKDMEIKKFNITEVTWLDNKPIGKANSIIADVQLSSEHITQEATISFIDNSNLLVNLHEPNYRVAPGQACVIYSNDKILGGVIKKIYARSVQIRFNFLKPFIHTESIMSMLINGARLKIYCPINFLMLYARDVGVPKTQITKYHNKCTTQTRYSWL
jgi:tRNA-specific 2-thiouridylase